MAAVPRFWRNITHRYNLVGVRCERCGGYYYPPRMICPKCRREGKLKEYTFSGKGKITSFTVVYSSTPDFEMQVPYVLAIVKLEEGPSLTAQIVCDPEEVEIGREVRAAFRKIGEESRESIIYYGTKFALA